MELLLLLFGITVLAVPVMLFRAFVLLPHAARTYGWKHALYVYKFSAAFAVVLTVYEAGNLTGFSWHRMRYVSDAELIQNAIRFAYPRIYDDLAALHVDYPSFEPKVRYWGLWYRSSDDRLLNRLLGFSNYQVKLPDVVVTLSIDGRARYTHQCDAEGRDITAPAHPVFGVIGTAQRETPTHDPVTDFQLDWADGAQGELSQTGHCFAAYSQSNPSAALTISSADSKPLEIRPRFGFYLVAAQLAPKTAEKTWIKGQYSQRRITLQEFLKWKSCSAAAKEEWPDIAGEWWQR